MMCVCVYMKARVHVHIETEGGRTELWSRDMWSGCTWFNAKTKTEGQTILLPSSFFQEWESDTTVGKRNLP